MAGSGKTLVSVLLIQEYASANLKPINIREKFITSSTDTPFTSSTDENSNLAESEQQLECRDNSDTIVIQGISVPKQPKKIAFCVPTIRKYTCYQLDLRNNKYMGL